ncbi:hypothetical protein WMF39_33555 [Sorangium sp. So ce1504]|uniref:hypothetical protein n=1 Tax=Sorangium sp. So ce1504 TaxID=3133337 RepID=UPI003F636210
MDFETPDDFTSANVAKYAPLAQGDDEYLIVHCANDQLLITGVGHKKMRWPGDNLLFVRVVGAGALRFFHRSAEIAYYAGGKNEPLVRWHPMHSEPALDDIVKAMDNMSEIVQDKRALATAALKMLITEVIRRRHGGIIAILNKDDAASMRTFNASKLKAPLNFGKLVASSWETSMVEGSRMDPSDDVIADAQNAAAECDRALSVIGRMSAVDGAVVATPELAIVGFRAKLSASESTPPIMRVNADGRRGIFDLKLKVRRPPIVITQITPS